MSLKDRAVELVLRARNMLSRDTDAAAKSVRDLGGAAGSTQARLEQLQSQKELINQFRQAERATEQAAEAMRKAEIRVEQLRQQLEGSGASAEQQSRWLSSAEQAAERAARSYHENSQALEQYGRQAREAGINTDRLTLEQARVGRETASTKAELREMSGEVDKNTSSVRNWIKVAAGTAAAYIGVRQLARGMSSLIRNAIATGDRFEQLELQMRAFYDTAEEAQSALQWIREFTMNTPLQVDGVTEAFTRLKAFGLDPMDGTLQTLVDQNAKLAGGQQELLGLIDAVGKAWATGRLQMDSINSLIQRGVPVWQLLQEQLGKSAEEIRQMASAGELGRREMQLLFDAIAKDAGGAAATQMATFSGIVSNLRDRMDDFLNRIARAGVLDTFKERLDEVADALDRYTESGDLQRWAENFSNAIVSAGNAARQTVQVLVQYRDAIMLAAKAWIFYKGAQAGAAILTMAANLRRALIPALVASTTATNAATGALGRLRLAILAIPGAGKIALLALAVSELPKLFNWAGTAIGEFAGKYSAAGRTLRETQERIRRDAEADIAATREQIAEFERYRDVRVRSASEILALSEDQRQAYLVELEGLKALHALEYRQALLREQIGDDTKAQQAELRDAIKETREALQSLATVQDRVEQGMEKGLSPAAASLVEQFNTLRDSGKDVEESLDGIFESLEQPGNFTQVQGLLQALDAISERSADTADKVRERLGKALQDLTGEELQRFVITMRAAFGEGEELTGKFATAAEEAADAAFRNLGSSLRQFRTGISDAERSAIDSFRAIEASGVLSADEIGGALSALVGQIRSPEAFKEVEALLENFRKRGIEVPKEVREALEAMAEGIKGTSQQIGRELMDGINAATSSEELNAMSDRIMKAWREGKIGVDEYLKALDGVSKRQAEIAEEARQAAKEAADAWKETGEEIEKAVGANRKEIGELRDDIGALTQATNNALISWQAWARYAEQNPVAPEIAAGIKAWREAQLEAGIATDEHTAAILRQREEMERAKQEAEQLTQSLEQQLQRMREQLAQLRGDQDEVDRLRFERERAELEAQLQQARALGDAEAIRNAQELLNLQREAYQLQQQQTRERERPQAGSGGSTQQAAAGPAQVAQPTRATRIELVTPTGTAHLTADSDRDEQLLLDALGRDARRTTH